MNTYDIPSYWSVDELYMLFNGVASMVGGNDFASLVKLVMIVGLMVAMVVHFADKQFGIVKWFMQATLLFSLLNLPVATVTIIDKTSMQPPKVVQNVPVMLAAIASTTATIGDWLARSYETIFALPDELKLQKHDIAFGYKILGTAKQMVIADPELRSDITYFIKDCVNYDIRDGAIDPQVVITGQQTWDYLFQNVNPGRLVAYRTMSAPKNGSCFDVANGGGTVAVADSLKARIESAMQAAQIFYGRRLNPSISDDNLAAQALVSQMQAAYPLILNASQAASDIIKQQMFINMWKEAGATIPQMTNDPAAVQVALATTQAAATANLAYKTSAALADDVMPRMHNIFEGIAYAIFPIMMILAIASAGRSGFAVIKNYFVVLASLALWPLFYAIINFYSTMATAKKVQAIAQATNGLAIQTADAVGSALIDDQALIGHMITMVPLLAWAMMKGGEMAMTSAIGHALAPTNSSAQQQSGIALGNVGMGNASMDTSSVNQTHANKLDTDLSMKGGQTTLRDSHGNAYTTTASGRTLVDQARNNSAYSVRDSALASSERSETAGRNMDSSTSVSTMRAGAETAAFQRLTASSHDRATSQDNSDISRFGESGSQDTRAGGGYSLNHSWMKKSGLTESDQAILGGNLSLGASMEAIKRNHGGKLPEGYEQKVDAAYNRLQGDRMHGEQIKANGNLAAAHKIDPADAAIVRAGRAKGLSPDQVKDLVAQRHGQEAAKAGGSTEQGRMRGGIGVDMNKQYQARIEKAYDDTQGLTASEDARRINSYITNASTDKSFTERVATNQTDRNEAHALLGRAEEYRKQEGSTLTEGNSVRTDAMRRRSNSRDYSIDMAQLPEEMESVASRNGMSIVQFNNLPVNRQTEMWKDYRLGEGQAAELMRPTSNLDGSTPKWERDDLKKDYAGNAAGVPNATGKKFSTWSDQVSTADTDAQEKPSEFGRSEGFIAGQKTATNGALTALPGKAQGMVNEVHNQASPDRDIGDTRRSTTAITEKNAANAFKSTVSDLKDKVLGKGRN